MHARSDGISGSVPHLSLIHILPHTWNAVDGQDGRGEYYRGACWYAKSFETPECMDGYRVYVEVLAAALSGRVYVNGQEVAYHEGGFSTFRADVDVYKRQALYFCLPLVYNRN